MIQQEAKYAYELVLLQYDNNKSASLSVSTPRIACILSMHTRVLCKSRKLVNLLLLRYIIIQKKGHKQAMNTSLTETPSLAPPSEAALSPSPHSGKHSQCTINRGDCQELPPDAVVDSCLGAVTPTFEPLKACLDDDSSLDDSEMSDCDGEPGDEFFFGEGEDIESMAMDCLNRPASAPRVIVSSPPSSMVPATTTSSGGPPSIIDASSADSSSAESAEQNSSQLARDKLAKELPGMLWHAHSVPAGTSTRVGFAICSYVSLSCL